MNPNAAHVPADPDWEARVRASFAHQGAMALIGATIEGLEPGVCVVVAPYRPDLSQQHGFFHAGVTSAVADSAGGYAARTLFPPDSDVLTVEFKINLIAPAHGDVLRARGEVVRSGRTLTICRVDAEVVRGGVATVCAVMQQTLMRVAAR
ncbi:MAG: PaaI family thioesterase [Candidatus Eremiobacteraeota bacterium]|nr:PaaI family thioesterase [Candidatus Eremiobacteraeota bacterium]